MAENFDKINRYNTQTSKIVKGNRIKQRFDISTAATDTR